MTENLQTLELVQPDLDVRPDANVEGSHPDVRSNAPGEVELTNLVQRVFVLPRDNAPRMVAFAGIEPEAGCSWICARVSRILAAHVAGSVCVVDANFRKPRLHEHFGVQNHRGLSDALLHSEPVAKYVQPISGDKLWLLSCGSTALREQTLFSDFTRQEVSGLPNQFQYVLLDSPSLNNYAEAVVLGGLAGGVILVIRAHSTRRELVKKAIADLNAARVRVLGAVLNQRTFSIPETLYRLT